MLYKPEKFGRLPTNPLFLLPIGTTEVAEKYF
jgi:hypothetical protein